MVMQPICRPSICFILHNNTPPFGGIYNFHCLKQLHNNIKINFVLST
jgi:hypothetical protein